MDFLIVSLLCFNHNLSLPVVATGMDFMASRFLGEILRRCGSFFMKRQFGKVMYLNSLFYQNPEALVFVAEFINKFIDNWQIYFLFSFF